MRSLQGHMPALGVPELLLASLGLLLLLPACVHRTEEHWYTSCTRLPVMRLV